MIPFRSVSYGSGILLAVFMTASLCGCGGATGPVLKYAEVTGKVMYKGAPLKMGQVMFQPPSGAHAVGEIKPDGTYTLKGVIGPNVVMIVSRDPAPPVTQETRQAIALVKSYIPDSYGVPSSGLSFEVKAGKNTADFDLR